MLGNHDFIDIKSLSSRGMIEETVLPQHFVLMVPLHDPSKKGQEG
jgi:hypothetical protein